MQQQRRALANKSMTIPSKRHNFYPIVKKSLNFYIKLSNVEWIKWNNKSETMLYCVCLLYYEF